MKYVATAAKALVLVCVVLLAVFNRETVTVVLIPGRIYYDLPLFMPILAGVLLGFFVATIFFAFDRVKQNKEIKKLKKSLANLHSEKERLHNLPLVEKREEE